MNVQGVTSLSGTIVVPPDKSISHRAVILACLAEGITEIKNFLNAEDCLRTVDAFRAMGVAIHRDASRLKVLGVGLRGLRRPEKEIYLGNSGTSMRLLAGVLAGQDFETTLTGDPSLSGRPMKRVIVPLRRMGAVIRAREDNFAPLVIRGGNLSFIKYKMPVASAQVKSAILLAGLYASGRTIVTEEFKSRDHTERLLRAFGADIRQEGVSVSVGGHPALRSPGAVRIPGDISSAAFFLVAGALLAGKEGIGFSGVGVNPTRTGIIDVLRRCGADIALSEEHIVCGEPIADLLIRKRPLRAFTIAEDEIPRLIDELPVLMVLAVFAKGTSVIRGAAELRVKETDRIDSMAVNLRKMGADIKISGNDITITGTGKLKGSTVNSYKDHRTAMSMAVAGLAASGETSVLDTDCINTSYPDFLNDIQNLIKI